MSEQLKKRKEKMWEVITIVIYSILLLGIGILMGRATK
jgi:hypothetical protein